MEGRIVEPTAAYDYGRLVRDIELLEDSFQDLQTETIGTSVMGKMLPSLAIGSGPRHVHVNAAFHANEWITSLALMTVLEELLHAARQQAAFAGADARGLLMANTLRAVPMVNPDGVDLVLHGASAGHPFRNELLIWNGGTTDFSGWKANIRGVDLNDQFPAYWEEERDRRVIACPGPRDYTGEAPLTEPEAQAMAAYTRHYDFDVVAALHTQGQEIYWNYRGYEPEESEPFAERLAAASGYTAVKLTGSDAGYKDWFIQQFRRPGFTIELGFGVNPLPVTQLPRLIADTRSILLELLR
ncbi:M14 family metallocarboxypeptidase [Paenibacillus chartarius]|uniref:M14 family metallocarboxypeptidase n=1 Tax=Paenibacillus chartarius TaxID=747481 RepID=A0ABV6DI73_9BACL